MIFIKHCTVQSARSYTDTSLVTVDHATFFLPFARLLQFGKMKFVNTGVFQVVGSLQVSPNA
jgi:hypothetical protein